MGLCCFTMVLLRFCRDGYNTGILIDLPSGSVSNLLEMAIEMADSTIRNGDFP